MHVGLGQKVLILAEPNMLLPKQFVIACPDVTMVIFVKCSVPDIDWHISAYFVGTGGGFKWENN